MTYTSRSKDVKHLRVKKLHACYQITFYCLVSVQTSTSLNEKPIGLKWFNIKVLNFEAFVLCMIPQIEPEHHKNICAEMPW